MAAKAPGTDVAKPAGTAVANWQEELKQLAVKTAEQEKPSGNWLSFRGGVLTIGGTPMKGNKVECVVVHSIHENQMYRGKFDPNVPASPICYALAEDEDDLAPHPDSPEPQAATCAVCPNNAWGSDPEGGKGKACKNVRRIAIMPATTTDMENIPKAEVALAKIPVTSVKNWSTYASQLATVLHTPPLAVITELSLEPGVSGELRPDPQDRERGADPSVAREAQGRSSADLRAVQQRTGPAGRGERPGCEARRRQEVLR